MKDILEKALNYLADITTSSKFDDVVKSLKSELTIIHADYEIIKSIDSASYYMKNDYSKQDTFGNMISARSKLTEYLNSLLKTPYLSTNITTDSKLIFLNTVLNNFYMFMESFFEKEPHCRAGIKLSDLNTIKIKNEYDVQHILYALLKPLFSSTRLEVTEDTGYASVRSDIVIPELSSVIEVKCSRDSMTAKKITEEIAADIVHYSYAQIYFFIYDKNKIIDNPQAFKSAYNKNFDGKEITIIIHQPKIL